MFKVERCNLTTLLLTFESYFCDHRRKNKYQNTPLHHFHIQQFTSCLFIKSGEISKPPFFGQQSWTQDLCYGDPWLSFIINDKIISTIFYNLYPIETCVPAFCSLLYLAGWHNFFFIILIKIAHLWTFSKVVISFSWNWKILWSFDWSLFNTTYPKYHFFNPTFLNAHRFLRNLKFGQFLIFFFRR